jgi:cell division protein FtsB
MWPAALAVLVCGVLFLGVFPTRTFLDQRRTEATAERRLAELDEERVALQERVDALRSDEEIERLARQQYGLARPGEEIYRVLPPAGDPLAIPDAWPFNRLEQRIDP